MQVQREKFATQVDSEVLASIRRIAKEDGRQLQAIVEDALKALIGQRGKTQARPHVIAAYQSSLMRYGSLYEKLAK